MIAIKPIRFRDRHWILRLMNQKSVRLNSFNQEKKTKKGNDAYWAKKLADPNFKAFASWLGRKPVALARIEKKVVSIAVNEKFRHKGIAFETLNGLYLGNCIAEIKPENIASIKLFEKLGFEKKESNAEKIVFKKRRRSQAPREPKALGCK